MGTNLFHLAQLASTSPAEFLVASIWQGLLLAALAWLVVEAAPKAISGLSWRRSPGTRFTLWMIVFVLAALLPFATLLHGSAASAATKARMLLPTARLSSTWAVALAGLWTLASLISLARLGWSGFRLHRIARSSTLIANEALSAEIQSVLHRAGRVSRPARISLSSLVDCPMVIGFFHRTIVLPQWLWSNLSHEDLHQIVLHEAAHLERRDDWTNLFQKLLRALFPLNPALYWAERQLCWEREVACDDAVLNRSVSPRKYATCLTNLAEKRMLNRLQLLAPGAWRQRSELSERVHRILASSPRLRPLHSWPAVGVLVIAFLAAGATLACVPGIVTFSAPGLGTHRDVASLKASSSGEKFRTAATNDPPQTRFVQASLPIAGGSRVSTPTLRHAVLRHRALPSAPASHLRLARVDLQHSPALDDHLAASQLFQAAYLTELHAQVTEQLAAEQQDARELFFPLYGAAPSPRLTPIPFAVIRSQSGWIILQL